MLKFNSLCLAICSCFSTVVVHSASGLVSMSDSELAATEGQALMSLSYIAPNDAANPMRNITGSNDIGFYKLGLEAEVELNANIRNLQLGCGGVNGSGACDIDIKNLSLSALPDSYDANGNPIYNNGRSSTSAKLTNPFIELAINNPNSASTREIKGIRFSAEKINALLTAGLANNPTASTTDGIQSLSGFMRIASTTGDVNTAPALFGTTADQQIAGRVATSSNCNGFLVICRGFKSYSSAQNSATTGITVPGMDNVTFNLPGFQVNGKRQTQAIAPNVTTTLASIPIAMPVNCSANYSAAYCNQWVNDQLRVQLTDKNNPKGNQDCILWVCDATFKMGEGSKLLNLNMNITFQQSLSMIHNIPLNGTGGYLSLQMMDLLWPGSYINSNDIGKNSLSSMSTSDVAKKGWWMSFADPVQLGYLKGNAAVDIKDVLPQVANLITQNLYDSGPIVLNVGDLGSALVNQPISKTLEIDIGSYTALNPAKLTLQNLQLKNQEVVTNCYGNLKFC